MIDKLKAELTGDPLGRGYAGMSDVAAAADLNTSYRTRNKTQMTASEILNSVDITEFNALAAGDETQFWQLMAIGNLDPFGVEATLMTNLFGGGSTTITTLASLRTESITRGVELGIGTVRVGHVEEARR
jgi:hypothetical protein